MSNTADRPTAAATASKWGPDGKIVDPGPPVVRHKFDYSSGDYNSGGFPLPDLTHNPNSRNQARFSRGTKAADRGRPR